MQDFKMPQTGAELGAVLFSLSSEQFDEVLRYAKTLHPDADLPQAIRRFAASAKRFDDEKAAEKTKLREQCRAALAGALPMLQAIDRGRALHADRVREVKQADDAARALLRSADEPGQLQAPDYMAALQAWGEGRVSTLAHDREAHIAQLTRDW